MKASVIFYGVTLALSGGAVLLVGQGLAAERTYDPEVVAALIDVFPKLKTNAEPRFAVPLPVMKRWIASQLAAAFELESDAPMDYLLKEWQAVVGVKDGVPTVELVMSVRVFRASPVKLIEVSLFPAETIYESVTVNGDAYTPLQEKGWSKVLISRPGEYQIHSRVKMEPTTDGDRRSLTFFADPFVLPSVRFDSDASLAVSLGGATQTLHGTDDAGTHGVLTPGHQRQVDLVWEPARETLVRTGTLTVEPSIAWQVQDRILSANARLMINVQGGERRSMVLELPQGADNVVASGPEVRKVLVEGRKVTLHFKSALSGRTPLSLQFDIPKPKGNVIRLPELVPMAGRVGSKGWVIVTDDAEGQIFEQSRAGMHAVSELELPTEVAGLAVGQPVLVYKRSSRSGSVSLDHLSTTPFPLVDTIADTANIRVTVRPSGEEVTRVRYMIRNNKSQFLRLTLPSTAKLLSIKVDGRDSFASGDKGQTLLPLVRSVQTLGGLVSFPVELTYLNKGAPFVVGQARRVDLPELDGVPTATITVTAWCPDGVHVETAESRLDRVDRFQSGGEAISLSHSTQPDPVTSSDPFATVTAQATAPSQQAFENTLGYNYWSAGYDAYRGNRLEEAETLLAKAEKYSSDTTVAGNANKLLGNIRLGRGEGLTKGSRAQQAKAKSIQASLQVDNNELEEDQFILIDQGLALIKQGKDELGAELLREADRVSGALKGRGSSEGKQEIVTKRYKDALAKVDVDKSANVQLNRTLEKLQKEADVITHKRDSKSLLFSDELANVSEAFQLSANDLQDATFQFGAQSKPKVSKVEAKARVRSALNKKGSRQSRIKSLSKGPTTAPVPQTETLAMKNDLLRQQVAVLEQTLDNVKIKHANVKANSFKAGKRLLGQAEDSRRQTAEFTKRIKEIQTEVLKGSQGELQGQTLDKELADVQNWAFRNQNTYGQVAGDLDRDLGGLLAQVQETQKSLEGQRKALNEVKTVTFDVSDFVQANGVNAQAELQQFFSLNLRTNSLGAAVNFSIEDGQVTVANDADNRDIFYDGLSNFIENSGSVVQVAGQSIDNPTVENNPALAGLFDKKTSDGRSYAILDQAQYQTILQAAQGLGAAAPIESNPNQRDVVVGSRNVLANESVVVSQSGADFNGLTVAGTAVNLAHNSLMCINNGTTLTFLRAGEVRDWGAVAVPDANGLIALVGHEMQIPEVGHPLLYEKTLLGAGESPDIVLTVKSIRR